MACNAGEKYVTLLSDRFGKKVLTQSKSLIPSLKSQMVDPLSLIWGVSSFKILKMALNIKDLYGNSDEIFKRFFMK